MRIFVSVEKETKKQIKGGKKMSFAEFVSEVLGFLDKIQDFLFNFGEYAQIFFDLLP